jgi:predicted ATPase
LEDALARLKNLPANAERDRKEIAIHTGLADIVIVTSGYAAAEYEHHLMCRYELAERLGDAAQLFYSLVGISVLSAFRLELNKAREIGGRLLALADQAPPEMQLQAHGSLANTLWLTGNMLGSREHCEKGLALFEDNKHLPPGDEHMRAACKLYAALCAAALGFPDEGLKRSLEFLTWAREKAQPLPLAFALNCIASVLAWRRDGAEMLKYANALLALSTEHGFSNWHSFGQINRGHALALLGEADEGIAEIKKAIAAYEATGAAVQGWVYSGLAFGYLVAENPADGLRVATKALQIAEMAGDGTGKAELHRLRGELSLMFDATATTEAEDSFSAAIDTARKQYARLAELRATMSLARLLTKEDHRDEARAMLADIYGWFTEGFETRDLKEAKALLDELTG